MPPGPQVGKVFGMNPHQLQPQIFPVGLHMKIPLPFGNLFIDIGFNPRLYIGGNHLRNHFVRQGFSLFFLFNAKVAGGHHRKHKNKNNP